MDDMFNPNEPLIQKLRTVIRFSVRCLAVLMTLVILWGVVDVAWEIYGKLRTPPVMLMNISDILATFGGVHGGAYRHRNLHQHHHLSQG